MAEQRIVSLLPSATEIVCALGAGGQLVGRSHECDFPAHVTSLPVCTEAQIGTKATSAVIDRDVKDLLARALSIYRVDVARLESLAPDVLVSQDQCEVCAVSRSDLESALSDAVKQKASIVSLTAANIEGLWRDIAETAAALGLVEKGKSVVAELQARLAKIQIAAAAIDRRPTVVCIEWTDPVMVAGNWVPELVTMAGAVDPFGRAGHPSPYLAWPKIAAADPDYITAMPCGFDRSRTRQEMTPLTDEPGWPDLRAVRDGCVFITDGNQYFNRPGPRLVESLEILAEIIHPGNFQFGHEGTGWGRL